VHEGRELLKDESLPQRPGTKRVVASCCNSAMMMRFDGPQHWIPVYRNRLGANAPAIQMRICTRCLPADAALPADVPASRDYPPALIRKLLTSRIAMLFGS
jgi:hypothetical protein